MKLSATSTKSFPTPWLIDQAFLDRYRIDLLVHGDDNSNEIDKKKLLVCPRTTGISSTLLRKRAKQMIEEKHDRWGWRSIWNRRGFTGYRALSLDDLIALNGFDTGSTAISSVDWRTNAQRIAAAIGIKAGDKVFEIGCGSGAFLLALQESVACEVAGADYSMGLIDVARNIFPGRSFEVVTAVEMDTSMSCDHAIAHSMFHYLTLAEASAVIEKMLTKATRTVGIFDIPDLTTRDAAEAIRRNNLPEGEYDKKYKGLSHTYYDKAWLRAEIGRLLGGASVVRAE